MERVGRLAFVGRTTLDLSNDSRLAGVFELRPVEKPELEIRYGPFGIEAIAFFEQKFVPALLGELTIRYCADPNGLL
jgi:hypothetical protein